MFKLAHLKWVILGPVIGLFYFFWGVGYTSFRICMGGLCGGFCMVAAMMVMLPTSLPKDVNHLILWIVFIVTSILFTAFIMMIDYMNRNEPDGAGVRCGTF